MFGVKWKAWNSTAYALPWIVMPWMRTWRPSGVGEGVGSGVGVGVGLAVGTGVGDGVGEGDGVALADGLTTATEDAADGDGDAPPVPPTSPDAPMAITATSAIPPRMAAIGTETRRPSFDPPSVAPDGMSAGGFRRHRDRLRRRRRPGCPDRGSPDRGSPDGCCTGRGCTGPGLGCSGPGLGCVKRPGSAKRPGPGKGGSGSRRCDRATRLRAGQARLVCDEGCAQRHRVLGVRVHRNRPAGRLVDHLGHERDP